MPCLFNRVTELKTLQVPDLILKVFCSPADNPETGQYLTDYQINIKDRREVSSNKYFNLASHRLHKSIQLRVFTGERFSRVVLSPADIRDYVRITFERHTDYDTTGNVLVKGIAVKHLPNPSFFGRRRGFRKLFGRDALYATLPTTVIGGSAQVHSSTSIGSA